MNVNRLARKKRVRFHRSIKQVGCGNALRQGCTPVWK
jgi:hypothetical protein